MKKKKLESENAEVSRNTMSQSTEYVTDGVIQYNRRKIKELPTFMTMLTSNIGLALACKHIFYNYEFSHAFFVCCGHIEVFDVLQKFSLASSYALSEESALVIKELKFQQQLYLQCGISISDFPDSLALQTLSRSLIFYGFSPFLTEFIDQSDKYSKNHCALTVSYQSLPPPGIGALFTLEKHTKPIYFTIVGGDNDSLAFTLSNKIHALNMSLLSGIGEILLPKLNETDIYKQMIIYLLEKPSTDIKRLNLINGTVIVTSESHLHSINFDSSYNFSKIFENVKIKKAMQISQNHILVCFEETKYFEVYNFYTGEMVSTQNFDFKIKFMQIDLSLDEISLPKNFDNSLQLVLVLENSAIHYLAIKNTIKANDKKGNELTIENMYSFKSPGIECISFEYKHNRFNVSSIFCFSFKDGSIILNSLDLNRNKNSNFILEAVKPNLKDNNQNGIQIQMTLSDYFQNDSHNTGLLFIGGNGFIYVYIIEDGATEFNFFKISGVYDKAYFSKKMQILGLNKGMLDVYQIKSKKDQYLGILLMSIDIHFMDITCVFFKGLVFYYKLFS